ncbi:MAG: hypothetical protein CMM60_05530, partial [Rhodospirillaceae bacterium]|nr:hypothetical protein [Rhodospirillaceae bacterium]
MMEDLRVLHEISLSPADKHIFQNYMFKKKGLFGPHYVEWRMKRIDKILELFGFDYFDGKRILELGGGHGDIGAFFAELGAEVLCLEGKQTNADFAKLKHRKIKNFKCVQCNLEKDFEKFGRFDLIINFGLLYHIKNVEQHLQHQNEQLPGVRRVTVSLASPIDSLMVLKVVASI